MEADETPDCVGSGYEQVSDFACDTNQAVFNLEEDQVPCSVPPLFSPNFQVNKVHQNETQVDDLPDTDISPLCSHDFLDIPPGDKDESAKHSQLSNDSVACDPSTDGKSFYDKGEQGMNFIEKHSIIFEMSSCEHFSWERNKK